MRLISNQGSNVTPQDDARLFSKLFSTGFWNSPAITSLGSNQVKIQAIRGMILGRDFEIEETTSKVGTTAKLCFLFKAAHADSGRL